MRTKHLLAFLVTLGSTMQARPEPVAPLGTFDLNLAQRVGAGATIAFFVARGSHLYFAVSSAGALAFQTDEYGTIQATGSLGAEPISGFDVDSSGKVYALHGGSRLSGFDSNLAIERTLSLPARVASFALIGGRPWGVGEDGKAGYLDGEGPGLNLADFPPPWLPFSIGPDGLGVLRPEASALHLAHGDGVSTIWLGKEIRNPIAATSGPGDKIYLLESPDQAASTSVVEYDNFTRPAFRFYFALPDAFHARMIGIAAEHLYIADPAGKIAFYPLNPPPSVRQVMDSAPELLTDTQPVREAAQKVGYAGTIEVDLEVNEDGRPQQVRIENSLAGVPKVMDAIQAWRFRPAVRSGKTITVPMRISINVN